MATTTAAVHEVNGTAAIQQALVGLGLPPGEHLVDAGFVAAELLVRSRQDHGIRLVGPPRLDVSWQNRTEGAYGVEVPRSGPMDVMTVQGTMVWAHGSLRVWFCDQKP